jgi:hypothetical protein
LAQERWLQAQARQATYEDQLQRIRAAAAPPAPAAAPPPARAASAEPWAGRRCSAAEGQAAGVLSPVRRRFAAAAAAGAAGTAGEVAGGSSVLGCSNTLRQGPAAGAAAGGSKFERGSSSRAPAPTLQASVPAALGASPAARVQAAVAAAAAAAAAAASVSGRRGGGHLPSLPHHHPAVGPVAGSAAAPRPLSAHLARAAPPPVALTGTPFPCSGVLAAQQLREVSPPTRQILDYSRRRHIRTSSGHRLPSGSVRASGSTSSSDEDDGRSDGLGAASGAGVRGAGHLLAVLRKYGGGRRGSNGARGSESDGGGSGSGSGVRHTLTRIVAGAAARGRDEGASSSDGPEFYSP